MKQTAVIFSALFVLLFSSILLSQETGGAHLGVGISIDPSRIGHVNIYYAGPNSSPPPSIVNQSPILFYFIIDTNKIRIEPLFGLNTTNSENTQTYRAVSNSNYNINTDINNISAITTGLGVFYLSALSNSFNLYFGPRIYFNFVSITTENKGASVYNGQYSSSDNKTETNELDITIGLAVGAEYFPFNKFSFGGEASINYTSYGNPDVTTTNTPPSPPPSYISSSERKQYSFNTSGIFFVRWYFI
ncbi:MAG: hypothetical protein M1480_16240 [Bacteroidetes bacterium]|nr:hypothetical protein [Bacteroidota bacterium]